MEKVLEWLKMPVMQVPDDIAVCEFECRETECPGGGWRCCERWRRGTTLRLQEARLGEPDEFDRL